MGDAVFIMVGQLDGVDKVSAVFPELIPEMGDRLGKVVATALVDPVLERPIIVEVEIGRQAFVVRRHLVDIVTPGLAYHIEVALAAIDLPGGVAAVVPLFEERNVVGGIVLVDPDHGVQAQACYAHLDPMVSRRGQRLESR